MRTYLFIFIFLLAGISTTAFAALVPGGSDNTCTISDTQDCASFIANCKKGGVTLPYEQSGVTPKTLVCSDRCASTSSETCAPFQSACKVEGRISISYGSTLVCSNTCVITSTSDACAAFKTACTAAGKTTYSDGVAIDCSATPTARAGNSGNSTASAGNFKPMVGIPGISGNYTLPGLINALYKLLIMIGALIGVTKIAIAGVKYATTDVVSAKGDAKKDIQGVLIGLLILLAPYIILSIINPNFANLNILTL